MILVYKQQKTRQELIDKCHISSIKIVLVFSSDGEKKLLENLNQLNQLLGKIIHCFKSLKMPHAGHLIPLNMKGLYNVLFY